MQVRIEQLAPGMIQQIQSMCGECSGRGERISPKDRCKSCEGKKVMKEKKIFEVHIDKGMEDGHRITFAGEGDMEPGLEEAGDIIVVLDEKEHETLKRVATEDLLMSMELTLTEALCGFQKMIKTLDNRHLVITAIPGEVIKHGAVKCIMGEGMPRYKNPFEKGKLIIQFLVKFPETVDPALVADLESILPPRPETEMPSKDAEEVMLVDLEEERQQANERQRQSQRGPFMRAGFMGPGMHSMADDDDDDHPGHGGGPGGVQCATH